MLNPMSRSTKVAPRFALGISLYGLGWLRQCPYSDMTGLISSHRKGHKFLDARKLCCNLHLPKIQEKRPNLRIFRQNDANEIANSEDPDQIAPPGAV